MKRFALLMLLCTGLIQAKTHKVDGVVSFSSIKDNAVVVNGTFKAQGTYDDSTGAIKVEVMIKTLATKDPARDFNIKQFFLNASPTIVVQGNLKEAKDGVLKTTITYGNAKVPVDFNIAFKDNSLTTTHSWVTLESLGLMGALPKLMSVCGHKAVFPSVAVSFKGQVK